MGANMGAEDRRNDHELGAHQQVRPFGSIDFSVPWAGAEQKKEPDEAEQPNQQGERELATPVQPRGKRNPAALFSSQANCPASVSDSFD